MGSYLVEIMEDTTGKGGVKPAVSAASHENHIVKFLVNCTKKTKELQPFIRQPRYALVSAFYTRNSRPW